MVDPENKDNFFMENSGQYTVYLAGPISDGPNPFKWHEHIQENWPEIGWINPFVEHDYPRSEVRNHIREIIEKDIQAVQASDAILLRRIAGRNLSGASIEAYVASEKNIPVITWNDADDRVPLFIEGHSDVVCETVDEAVECILKLLNS